MADQKVLRFRFQGVEYQVDGSMMTGKLERELWKATGMSLQQVGEALAAGTSFAFSAMLWLGRRQGGERVTYQAVEEYIDGLRADEMDVELLGDEEVAGDPQP